MSDTQTPTKKLVLHIAVPGIWADDLEPSAELWSDGEAVTPRHRLDVLLEEWMRPEVGLTIVTLPGDKCMNDDFAVFAYTGEVVGAETVNIDGSSSTSGTAPVGSSLTDPTDSIGIAMISDERDRQRRGEGFDSSHDDQHIDRELVRAAIRYAAEEVDDDRPNEYRDIWPWDESWWKPSPVDPIKNLVKAGALIAAEIDRLDRLNQIDEERIASLS